MNMPSSINVRKVCFLLNVCGFMDFFAVGMIMPLMSSRIRELGGSPTLTGLIGSIYGGVQLLSNPLMGKVSDNVGRYPCLLMSVIFTALGYGIVGAASSISLLALGRFVLGCFKHNHGISKAYIYDILPEKETMGAIGQFNSFASFGFILGPIIGGHIADGDGGVPLAAFCSACLFVIHAGLIWGTIPNDGKDLLVLNNKLLKPRDDEVSGSQANESHQSSLRSQDGDCRSHESQDGDCSHHSSHPSQEVYSDHCHQSEDKDCSYIQRVITKWKQAFSKELLNLRSLLKHWNLLLVTFLAGLAVIMYRTNFTLNLREKYGASRTTIGYLSSYTASISAIFGFFVDYITKRYKHKEYKLLFHSILLQMASLVCLCLAPSLPSIVLFLMPLSFGTSITRICSTSLHVNVSGKGQVAAVLGWNQSIYSFSFMMAPLLVGVMQEWSMDGAYYVSVLAMALAVVVMLFYRKDSKVREEKQKEE